MGRGWKTPIAAAELGLRARIARAVAVSPWRPEPRLDCEPMFDSKMTLTERLTDAVDLLIDFATLGEYGLEPVEGPAARCQSRRRRAALPDRRRVGERPFAARL